MHRVVCWGTHGTTYSETRGKWKGRRMNKREACAFIKPRGVPRSAIEPSQTFNHFDRYGFTNVSKHIKGNIRDEIQEETYSVMDTQRYIETYSKNKGFTSDCP